MIMSEKNLKRQRQIAKERGIDRKIYKKRYGKPVA